MRLTVASTQPASTAHRKELSNVANWRKKIEAGGGKDLRPGEELRAGVLLQPDGTAKSSMAKGLGGVIAEAAVNRGRNDDQPELGGVASVLPDDRCWLGVTNQRILIWKFGMMRGRPAGLLHEIPVSSLERVETEERKMTHGITLFFSDGSARGYEVPKLGNDTPHFAAVVNS